MNVEQRLTFNEWRRGVLVNALVSINEVAVRQARLVLGWVFVCGQVNHLGMQPTTQVNSAFHPSGAGNWPPGVKAGRVYLCRVAGNTV